MTPAPYAVLWDLDGALVDSNQLHWLAWRDTLATQGHSLTFEQFTAAYGQRNDAILRGWLGAAVSEAAIAAISDAKELIYRRLVRTRGGAAARRRGLAATAARGGLAPGAGHLGPAPMWPPSSRYWASAASSGRPSPPRT